MSATMRAALQERYGGPDALRVTEIERPTPNDDEVLLRVRAASVNFGDWAMLTGRPWPLRLAFGLRRPRKPIAGMDVAGEVCGLGAKATAYQPGDAVFGEIRGAWADYAVAKVERLAQKPQSLSFEEAATLPVAGVTALQGLRDAAKLRSGQRVLINGASGGVGSFAVQIAKALGAEVSATSRAHKQGRLRDLGADHLIDYEKRDFTQEKARYDVIFDLVGNHSVGANLAVLTEAGRYVSSSSNLGLVLRAGLYGLFSQRVALHAAKPKAEDLAELARLADEGVLRPAIDRRFALEEIREALTHQGRGHANGKSVICVS